MKMEQTVCSETLALKVETPVNHPEESTQNIPVAVHTVPPDDEQISARNM
jgi:hypothetical protein